MKKTFCASMRCFVYRIQCPTGETTTESWEKAREVAEILEEEGVPYRFLALTKKGWIEIA